MRFGFKLAAAIGAFGVIGVTGTVLLRTLVSGPPQLDPAPTPVLAVDSGAVAERLAGAVRFKTISFDAFEHQVGRPKPSEGGGMRETPPHVSYDILCLSSSQEID